MRKTEAKTKKEMQKLLRQKLSEEEKEALKSEGFCFSNPTRETLILVALYKKAAAGDMTAIREIRSMTSLTEEKQTGGEVTIIDNVPNNDG